jgi:hypothetical protein
MRRWRLAVPGVGWQYRAVTDYDPLQRDVHDVHAFYTTTPTAATARSAAATARQQPLEQIPRHFLVRRSGG